MEGVPYLWLGVVAGLAASPHCAGMCGAFPLHLARGGQGRPLVRHALYAGGKLLTYSFLGALAGAGGKLFMESHFLSASRDALAYLAGALLILFAVAMLGWLPFPDRGDWAKGPGLLSGLFGQFMASPGSGAGFLLGAGAGFLPCPITLAMLAVAAASQSVPHGLLALTGLGLGTAPVLVGIGLSGSLLDARVRRIGLRGAAAIVLLIGVVTLLRPTGVLCRVLPSGWGH